MKSAIRFLLVLYKNRKLIVTTTIVVAVSAGGLRLHLDDVDVSWMF